jgi:hypothetical protein
MATPPPPPAPPDLPDAVRSRLFALGMVDGNRIRTPMDSIQSWLIRRAPPLVDEQEFFMPRMSRQRAVSRQIDRFLSMELSQKDAIHDLWSFGGGFQTRWYRFRSTRKVHHRDVETPEVMAYKEEMYGESPWGNEWFDGECDGKPVAEWTVSASENRPLVVLESLWERLGAEVLRGLLLRIHHDMKSDGRVLLDLPGHGHATEGPWWPDGDLRRMGWRVEADVRAGHRRQLATATQVVVAPSVEPFRVVVLSPC